MVKLKSTLGHDCRGRRTSFSFSSHKTLCTISRAGDLRSGHGLRQIIFSSTSITLEIRTPCWLKESPKRKDSTLLTPNYVSDVSRVSSWRTTTTSYALFEIPDNSIKSSRKHATPKVIKWNSANIICNTHNNQQHRNSIGCEEMPLSEKKIPHIALNTTNSR